jgi:hypothetical protein
MIAVEDKQVVFIHPKTKQTVLRRDAVFAHRCPKCSTIIHCMVIHPAGSVVPPTFRAPQGHAQQINLKLFGEPRPPFMTDPDYVSSMADLGHVCGQYFFDGAHFTQSKFHVHGRCKYLRAVYQFDNNRVQETIRVVGLLESLYGPPDKKPDWFALCEKLEKVPGLAEVVMQKVMAYAVKAPDIVGNASPAILIAKEDWDYKSFGSLIETSLAWTPQEETEGVTV